MSSQWVPPRVQHNSHPKTWSRHELGAISPKIPRLPTGSYKYVTNWLFLPFQWPQMPQTTQEVTHLPGSSAEEQRNEAQLLPQIFSERWTHTIKIMQMVIPTFGIQRCKSERKEMGENLSSCWISGTGFPKLFHPLFSCLVLGRKFSFHKKHPLFLWEIHHMKFNSSQFSSSKLNLCHFSPAFIFSDLQNAPKSQKTWWYLNEVVLFCKGEASYWKL